MVAPLEPLARVNSVYKQLYKPCFSLGYYIFFIRICNEQVLLEDTHHKQLLHLKYEFG